MRIAEVKYKVELGGKVLDISYELDGDYRAFRVGDIFKKYILERQRHNGINEVNYIDFVTGKDVKYKLNEDYVLKFLCWYHKM